ncbi:MAG: hypothetical protein QOF71_2130 [Candidatus Eremiobacteraeota bacterium]|jgi:hypothetical protein|nr:hypothetical protein [Candidatus Eremiobacteraeota bacterium]
MPTATVSQPDDLDQFVRAAKAKGIADDALVALLRQNGWAERRIYRSLSGYYADALGMVPPSRSGRTAYARDAFYYLLNFITLGFWTVALGQLFYVLIERRFPDPVSRYVNGMSSGALLSEIAWQLATIIVAYPCFVVIGRLIARENARRPDALESGVRAWITYLALVIAAIIVLMDGIWFLNALLRGELTVKFVLDSLVLLVLGGGVFAYYLNGLRPAAAER